MGAAAGGDLFAQIIAVAGLVLGSGGVLAVFTDRRKRRKEAERIGAEANKLGIEGEVAISGATLEWARDFRQEARDAKAEASAATSEAREARQQADACEREALNLREELADLRVEIARKDAQWDELLTLVRGSCHTPPLCQAFKQARLAAGS